MRVDNVKIVWENDLCDGADVYGELKKIEIVFSSSLSRPTIFIDAGVIKIEDKTLDIDSKEIIKSFERVDYETWKCDGREKDFTPGSWKVIINDKVYSGVREEPKYLKEVKKIIRFNVFIDYANKKMAKYLK